MNMQDAFMDILYGYAFFMRRDLEIHQKPISIFCEDDISKHSNIFCKTFFFFSYSIRKNKKLVVIVVFEIDIILGQYGHCP